MFARRWLIDRRIGWHFWPTTSLQAWFSYSQQWRSYTWHQIRLDAYSLQGRSMTPCNLHTYGAPFWRSRCEVGSSTRNSLFSSVGMFFCELPFLFLPITMMIKASIASTHIYYEGIPRNLLTHGTCVSCTFALCMLNVLHALKIKCYAYCNFAYCILAFRLIGRPRSTVLRGCNFANYVLHLLILLCMPNAFVHLLMHIAILHVVFLHASFCILYFCMLQFCILHICIFVVCILNDTYWMYCIVHFAVLYLACFILACCISNLCILHCSIVYVLHLSFFAYWILHYIRADILHIAILHIVVLQISMLHFFPSAVLPIALLHYRILVCCILRCCILHFCILNFGILHVCTCNVLHIAFFMLCFEFTGLRFVILATRKGWWTLNPIPWNQGLTPRFQNSYPNL